VGWIVLTYPFPRSCDSLPTSRQANQKTDSSPSSDFRLVITIRQLVLSSRELSITCLIQNFALISPERCWRKDVLFCIPCPSSLMLDYLGAERWGITSQVGFLAGQENDGPLCYHLGLLMTALKLMGDWITTWIRRLLVGLRSTGFLSLGCYVAAASSSIVRIALLLASTGWTNSPRRCHYCRYTRGRYALVAIQRDGEKAIVTPCYSPLWHSQCTEWCLGPKRSNRLTLAASSSTKRIRIYGKTDIR